MCFLVEHGKHWRQRLSATVICGRVMVVTAAAAREKSRGGNGEAPEEISAHSLGQTASTGYTSATAFKIEWCVSKRSGPHPEV